MKINFVTPSINATKFSGGIYCILKYADGLYRNGHDVTVTPCVNSGMPQWINCQASFRLAEKNKIKLSSLSEFKHSMLNMLELASFKYRSDIMKSAINNDYLSRIMPRDSDVTVATAWETVEPVYRYGSGKKVYFMQHFETVFFEMESYEKFACEMSYQSPLLKIANSQWLYNKVRDYEASRGVKSDIFKCVNAVDHNVYRNTHQVSAVKPLKIISYGGRCVTWKGFLEMAHAVALTRSRLPDHPFEWLVYGGDAALPPDNPIASYRALGFLKPEELNQAYNLADILLSASWYESFPLFPIEAMACGLAVITTQEGTEDYAFHGNTAHIVKPRNVESIAEGLCKVISNHDYRMKLGRNGEEISKKFTWESSVANMENILNLI